MKEESRQKILEAAKRGNETKKIKWRAIYEATPHICSFCNTTIPYEFRKTRKKFCSHSCCAKFNNPLNSSKKCLLCNIDIVKGKYCSQQCGIIYRQEQTIVSGKASAVAVKRYLLRLNGVKCQMCGLREWLGSPILLIADHINGNSQDNTVTNIRLVCSNCDATLPTYKAKNKGNGRFTRLKRFQDGKSY